MYKLYSGFRMLDSDISFFRNVDNDNIRPSEKRYINEAYSYYLGGKIGYDLLRLEQKEDKNRNVTRIKLRLLNWLSDFQETGNLDAQFFFSLLTCRESAQILASKVFYKE